MKVNVTEQDWNHLDAAVWRGALEGALTSAAIAVPSFYYLHRRSAWYRSLPFSLRVAGVVMVVAPWTSIQAERRSLEFERARWSDSGKLELDRAAADKEARFNALSTTDKALDWASRHQYSIILGSWALSMAVAGAIVAKDRYVSCLALAVQVRMWAQGLTIGVLVAAGAMTHKNRQEAAANGMRRSATDHSWQTFLEEQQREQEARKVTLNVASV
ncbi:hypothetical protein JVT61DRAFT_1832 [Boletus reticuloceps]|uniref:HIG1 domain-containing protein n=1 Tax=Boletus reticuloceps TaxID=495285 RepID=A0A8I2YJG9_9AGAM|nr:hypothetical protein JVT61DRAFT_7126 [Boletus reticuloceps]KAG6376806.1 hypothetical protein JVT61DRAFT_1832 [Boletus reticuloceps]